MLDLYRMNAVRICSLLKGKFPPFKSFDGFYMMGRLALNGLGRMLCPYKLLITHFQLVFE